MQASRSQSTRRECGPNHVFDRELAIERRSQTTDVVAPAVSAVSIVKKLHSCSAGSASGDRRLGAVRIVSALESGSGSQSAHADRRLPPTLDSRQLDRFPSRLLSGCTVVNRLLRDGAVQAGPAPAAHPQTRRGLRVEVDNQHR